MGCLHCGGKISLVRRLKDREFCSHEHRQAYEAGQVTLMLARLEEEEPPCPPETRSTITAPAPQETERAREPVSPIKEVEGRVPDELGHFIADDPKVSPPRPERIALVEAVQPTPVVGVPAALISRLETCWEPQGYAPARLRLAQGEPARVHHTEELSLAELRTPPIVSEAALLRSIPRLRILSGAKDPAPAGLRPLSTGAALAGVFTPASAIQLLPIGGTPVMHLDSGGPFPNVNVNAKPLRLKPGQPQCLAPCGYMRDPGMPRGISLSLRDSADAAVLPPAGHGTISKTWIGPAGLTAIGMCRVETEPSPQWREELNLAGTCEAVLPRFSGSATGAPSQDGGNHPGPDTGGRGRHRNVPVGGGVFAAAAR